MSGADLGLGDAVKVAEVEVAAALGLPARAFWAPLRPWFGTVLLLLDKASLLACVSAVRGATLV